jgi:hypothetical protein
LTVFVFDYYLNVLNYNNKTQDKVHMTQISSNTPDIKAEEDSTGITITVHKPPSSRLKRFAFFAGTVAFCA